MSPVRIWVPPFRVDLTNRFRRRADRSQDARQTELRAQCTRLPTRGNHADWTLLHALNGLLVDHPLLADGFEDFSVWSVPLLAVATLGLWFIGRPGTTSRWKLATTSALASAGVALLINQAIGQLWAP